MKFREAQELFPRHDDLAEAEAKLAKATRKYDSVRKRIQEECPHEVVADFPFRSGMFLDQPRYQVCFRCGLRYGGVSGQHVYDMANPFNKSKKMEVER